MCCLFVYLKIKCKFRFNTESSIVPSQPFATKEKKKSSAKNRQPSKKQLEKKQSQKKNKQKHESETESEEELEEELEEAWKDKNRAANSQSILEPVERSLRPRAKK